jgi:hypothetical protein
MTKDALLMGNKGYMQNKRALTRYSLFPLFYLSFYLKGFEMKRKIIDISVILLGILIILCGCQLSAGKEIQDIENSSSADTAAVEPDGESVMDINSSSGEKPQGVLSSKDRSQQQWKFVNLFSRNLGKTICEIAEKTGYQLEYKWYDDNSERLVLHDGGIDVQSLLFSDSIWKEGSYCTGVYMGAEDTWHYDLPDTPEEMKAQFGEQAVWYPKNENQNAYYRYDFDDNVEVMLFSNPEGTTLDKNVIIKMTDASNLIGERASEEDPVDTDFVLDPEARYGIEWKEANYYQGFIGKTLEEIKAQYPDIAYHEEYNRYVDPKTDIFFCLYGEYMATCYFVGVPAKLIFTGLPEGPISRDELLNYWHIPHTWNLYEWPFYHFRFEDVMIFICTDINGTIDEDEIIAIKLD